MFFRKSSSFFDGTGGGATEARVPAAYARQVLWLPGIGDIFADFSADSTFGRFEFHDWAKGQWTVVFGHPQANSAVCATEIAEFAAAQDDFDRRNVRLLGVTQSDIQTESAWIADIEGTFDVSVVFPVVADEGGKLARLMGMFHPNSVRPLPVRKTFILDETMRIRAIFEYPNAIGRSTHEILRVIDGMQIVDRDGLYAPANWEPGNTMVVPPTMSDEEAETGFAGRWLRVNAYLRTAVPGRRR
ncbi:redoxin domain-containing protein [Palleronia pelagia]|uniref:Alkyl hydroperoxide reductase C n=1 Tax=Palleronia pelagia TaxID=387096 RepID=A0A1H8FQE3_9RHOB|nr:redoxin domain-containing protein [Palleronia pelagia]SEN33916.1 Alkyl hydroperoxide reductase subunit AhpC (peroxiredoxin) [Palleronia pelagia]